MTNLPGGEALFRAVRINTAEINAGKFLRFPGVSRLCHFQQGCLPTGAATPRAAFSLTSEAPPHTPKEILKENGHE